MKSHLIRSLFSVIGFVLIILLISCGGDDNNPEPDLIVVEPDVTVTLNDASLDFTENPNLGDFLISLTASSTGDDPIIYQIIEQSVSDAVTFNRTAGELFVYEPAAFDYETNEAIIVKVRATSGIAADTATVTITINDVVEFDNAFVTKWKTTISNQTITIPTRFWELDYNFSVDWGDGSEFSTGQTENAFHIYENPGVYTVKITGDFPAIFFNDTGDEEQIISIEQWGNIAWETMERAFTGCVNLTYNATDSPDLSGVTSLKSMFQAAFSFDGDLNSWDVSSINNMEALFDNCASFNGDISQWDVSQVENMHRIFGFTNLFNVDISNWNVSNVTDMSSMFGNARSFNQDLSSWDVSSVTDMEFMFYTAAAFEGKNIRNWDVSAVTNMSYLFSDAYAFSEDITQWNVSNVTSMNFMFTRANSFDLNLGSWDISNVTGMGVMFTNSAMSIANYDATLDGWSKLNNPPENITLGADNLQYCEVGERAREFLINNHNWSFSRDERASDADCQ